MGIYEKNNCRILGKGQWISNDDIKSGLNNNDLIIGGTGSGKTDGDLHGQHTMEALPLKELLRQQ